MSFFFFLMAVGNVYDFMVFRNVYDFMVAGDAYDFHGGWQRV